MINNTEEEIIENERKLWIFRMKICYWVFILFFTGVFLYFSGIDLNQTNFNNKRVEILLFSLTMGIILIYINLFMTEHSLQYRLLSSLLYLFFLCFIANIFKPILYTDSSYFNIQGICIERWDDNTFYIKRSVNFFLTSSILANTKIKELVDINDDAADVLLSWQKQSSCEDKNELVFPEIKGSRYMYLHREWQAVLKEAGIENFRWHDMRHDFASQLVMAGVDIYTVCKMLNHSDVKITMKYAHLAPDRMKNAAQVLNRRNKGDKIIGRIRPAQND
jgi:hypothetical protein